MGKIKTKPLNDVEMHELLRLLYPDHIRNDDNEYFEISQEVCAHSTVYLGRGVDVNLSDLLGRLVMLTMPMESALTKRFHHCLGSVTIKHGTVRMTAAVHRESCITLDEDD